MQHASEKKPIPQHLREGSWVEIRRADLSSGKSSIVASFVYKNGAIWISGDEQGCRSVEQMSGFKSGTKVSNAEARDVLGRLSLQFSGTMTSATRILSDEK